MESVTGTDDDIDEILNLNANSPLNLLMSDDEISDEGVNEGRFKSASGSGAIQKKSAVMTLPFTKIVSNSIIDSKKVSTLTPTSTSAVSSSTSGNNIVFQQKNKVSAIAQVMPIKKVVRKHTPIVFDDKKATASTSNTTDCSKPSQLIRNVQKIDDPKIANDGMSLIFLPKKCN